MNDKAFRTRFLLDNLGKKYRESTSEESKNITKLISGATLIIAPHADDEVIGCGGLICELAKSNTEVTVLIVTKESSRSISKWVGNDAEDRVSESYEAKKVLGYNNLIYFDFPELLLSSDPDLQKKYRLQLYELLERLRPKNIFIPNMHEMHPDHRIIGGISIEELKSGNHDFIDKVFLYEVWGPVRMNAYIMLPDDVMKKKVDALSCYKTQLSSVDYISVVKFLNEFRGNAEAFRLIQKADLPDYIK